MSYIKLQDSLGNLERAVHKLSRALEVPRERELVLEGTIQRFEFVIELLWKTMGRALEHEGVVGNATPRAILKAAYAADWLSAEEPWLDLIDIRNRTSHAYLHESMLAELYDEIRTSFPEIQSMLEWLRERYPSSAG